MNRAHRLIGVITSGIMIALTGCGAATGAAPQPTQQSAAQPASPIPPVKNPRDVTALAKRPCELLTARQAQEFGLGLRPKQYDFVLGTVGCEWATTSPAQETVRQVNISTFTNNPTLEVVYSKDQNRPFFELTTIAGYPAIATRTNRDIPICDIYVKPAERQSFTLTYEGLEFRSNPQQSCEVGKQVAAAVLMNLPLKS